MMCSACRKKKDAVPETRWEKIRFWFFERFFIEEIKSVSSDAGAKSFADGYTVGLNQAKDMQKRYDEIRETGNTYGEVAPEPKRCNQCQSDDKCSVC